MPSGNFFNLEDTREGPLGGMISNSKVYFLYEVN